MYKKKVVITLAILIPTMICLLTFLLYILIPPQIIKWEDVPDHKWISVSYEGRTLHKVIFEQGTFIAVGEGGTMLASNNVADWEQLDSGTQQALHDIAVVNGIYVAVGSGGTIIRSEDGTNWETMITDSSYTFNRVVFAFNRFFAFSGMASYSLTSVDGVIWTKFYNIRAYGDYVMNSFVTDDEWFYAVGSFRHIIRSTNGTDFEHLTAKYWPQWKQYYEPFNDVIQVNNHYIAIAGGLTDDGNYGFIARSKDGVNWKKINRFEGTSKSIAFGNGKYYVVGSGMIFHSINGENWYAERLKNDQNLYSVSYGDGFFVAVGEGGLILANYK